jgi:Uma2 family endonuclease
MTAAHRTGESMTLNQFLELPVDNACRYELADGELHVKARPVQPHLRAAHRLVSQLNQQLVDGDRHCRQLGPLNGTVSLSSPWSLTVELGSLAEPR